MEAEAVAEAEAEEEYHVSSISRRSHPLAFFASLSSPHSLTCTLGCGFFACQISLFPSDSILCRRDARPKDELRNYSDAYFLWPVRDGGE
jgi:hypothetical protein